MTSESSDASLKRHDVDDESPLLIRRPFIRPQEPARLPAIVEPHVEPVADVVAEARRLGGRVRAELDDRDARIRTTVAGIRHGDESRAPA